MKLSFYLVIFCWLAFGQASYTQNLPAIRIEGGKYALLDTKNGKLLTPYKYEDITSFQEGLAVATLRIGAGKAYTYLNEKGEEIILPTPKRLFPFVQGRAIFKQDKKFGFLDKQGREIIAAQYTKVYDFQEDVALVIQEEKQMIIDSVGKVFCTLPKDAEAMQTGYSDGLLVIKQLLTNELSYIDKQGNTILNLSTLQPLPTNAGAFIKGTAIIEIKQENNTYKGLINKKGEWLLKPTFQDIERVKEGFWVSQKEEIYKNEQEYRYSKCLYDHNLQIILPCMYKTIYALASPNSRVVEKYTISSDFFRKTYTLNGLRSTHFEVQDSTGKVIFPHQAEDIWITQKGDFIVKMDTLYEIYTAQGVRTGIRSKLLIGYENNGVLQESFFQDVEKEYMQKYYVSCIKFNQKIAFADVASKKILTDFFDEFLYTEDLQNYQHIPIRNGKKWIYKDSLYEDIGFLNKHLLLVKKQQKWAIIDIDLQKNITPFLYDSIIPKVSKLKFDNPVGTNRFEIAHTMNFMPENCLIACYQNKWGIIDFKGIVKIPFQFEAIRDMYFQYIIVEKNKKVGIFDYAGKLLFPYVAGHIEVIGNYIYVHQNKKVGLYDFHNQFITRRYYDSIVPYQKGEIVVFEHGKMGWLDKYGNTIFPPIYEKIYHINYASQTMKTFIRENIPPYIILKQNNKYGLANRQYKTILPTVYDDIDTGEFLVKNLIVAKKDNKKGLFDHEGTTLLPPIYDNIENLDGNPIGDNEVKQMRQNPTQYIRGYYVKITLQNKQGVFDLAGKQFLPIIYDEIEVIRNENAIQVKQNGITQKITLPKRP